MIVAPSALQARADLNFVVTTLKADRSLRVRVIGASKHTEPITTAKRRVRPLTHANPEPRAARHAPRSLRAVRVRVCAGG
eukprot:2305420-Prymnesium_polylepis.1